MIGAAEMSIILSKRCQAMVIYSTFFCFRLSRARRVVENAFGILSSRFRVLRNPILQSYKNSISTVKATVVLHNYTIQNLNKDNRYYNPASLCREDGNGGITPAVWEQGPML